MKPFLLQDAVEACGGRLFHADSQSRVQAICTDSRQIKTGALFLALKGDRFDAHHFLTPELVSRLTCAMVHRPSLHPGLPPFPMIDVSDVRQSMGRLARWHRRRFDVPVVGITGSNGKTSTKAFLKAALSSELDVLASPASYNNDVGIPISLLQMESNHQVVIMEIGTNHPGEIEHLTRMVHPQIGIITSISGGHLGHFGSVDAVAAEKGWLAELLPTDGVFYMHADSPWFRVCCQRTSARIVSVGFREDADWQISQCAMERDHTACVIRHRGLGVKVDFRIPIPGCHQALNAGMAFATAFELGVSPEKIVQGLSVAKMPSMRMEMIQTDKYTIWNDAYNANEDSVLAAMETFRKISTQGGRRIMLLGDLNELGDHANEVYQRLADAAVNHAFDLLVGGGQGGSEWIAHVSARAHARCLSYATLDAAVNALPRILEPDDQLLLKGSRGAHLECISRAIVEGGKGGLASSTRTGKDRIEGSVSCGRAMEQQILDKPAMGVGSIVA